MASNYIIEVRVKGDSFDAETISLKEIADFMVCIEQMITSIVMRDHPELALTEDDVVLGLSSITQGSLIQRYVTKYEAEVSQAYVTSTAAIETGNFDRLPQSTIKAVHAIRRFNRDHNTRTEFWHQNGKLEQLTTISSQTRIQIETFVTRGTTTLYGDLLRIGGEDPPRAYMRFIDGSKKSCRIKSIALARQMAPFLYQRIGVRGVAHWDARDMSLHEFRIERLVAYRQKTIGEAISSLREAVGPYYENIEDVEGLIADIRGNDENDS